jgi:hypothetical protein
MRATTVEDTRHQEPLIDDLRLSLLHHGFLWYFLLRDQAFSRWWRTIYRQELSPRPAEQVAGTSVHIFATGYA